MSLIKSLILDKEFNIYELVKNAVALKCILPSQNSLVMETYYAIKEYLLILGVVIEKEEMSSYFLTDKGKKIITFHSIEEFEKTVIKKKRTIFQILFHRKMKDIIPNNIKEQMMSYYE